MFPNKSVVQLLGTLLFSLTAPYLHASASTDAEQEITIFSDRAELDRKTGMVVYQGNVILTQGSLKIESDKLTLLRIDGQLQQAIADGKPARYQQAVGETSELTKASGEQINYFADERTIKINGDAELAQEGNLFSGEQIIYDLNNERVMASNQSGQDQPAAAPEQASGERIKVVIQPQPNPQNQSQQEAQ